MENCLFCRVAQGKISSYPIWENDEFLAILDIFPNTRGQVLILPKVHYSSDPVEVPAEIWQRAMAAAQEVMELLKTSLGVYRVACVVEGMGVNHLHIKLYPLHGLDATWSPHAPESRVFLESYPGYLTTQLGPAALPQELSDLASHIREGNKDL